MIDHLRTMAIFQTVAEQGSFRAAAKALKLSPSVISHHISQLEAHLGLPLLYRSTRRMSLTDAGQDLLAASQRMTRAASEGLAAMSLRKTCPAGTLRITLPTPSGTPPFADIYARFARTYPDVKLRLNLTDQRRGLEGSEFDVAIRGSISDLDDSTYRARRLGRLRLCIFAAADYVRSRPAPTCIDDLADWDYIEFLQIPWKARTTTVDGVVPTREPIARITCDSYAMARHLVDEGLGFIVENHTLAARGIRDGHLVEILPEVRLRPLEIYAVYPANAPEDGLARLFIDFLSQRDLLEEMGIFAN